MRLTDSVEEATWRATVHGFIQNEGRVPNYEASMCKLYSSELNQRIARTGMKMIGQHGGLWGESGPNNGRYSFSSCVPFHRPSPGGRARSSGTSSPNEG